MPNVQDVLKVTYCGQYLNQQVCNVMYYVVAIWTQNTSLEDVIERLADDWFTTAARVQVPEFLWLKATLTNVVNPAEYAEYVPAAPVQGIFIGESTPPFVAASIRQNRQTAITRNGYKRIAGIAESQTDDGYFGPGITPSQDWLDLAGLTYLETTDPSWQVYPAIVGRDATGAPDLTRINFPVSATLQRYVTTQNTRKVGRGS